MSSTHRVSVDLLGNVAFRAITETGHEVVMDAAPEVGGSDTGPRPMELLLVGVGGCTGMDVISMLRKMRQDVTDYEIQVSGERAAEHPKIYTTIRLEHIVRGRALNAESVRRAVELSATRGRSRTCNFLTDRTNIRTSVLKPGRTVRNVHRLLRPPGARN